MFSRKITKHNALYILLISWWKVVKGFEGQERPMHNTEKAVIFLGTYTQYFTGRHGSTCSLSQQKLCDCTTVVPRLISSGLVWCSNCSHMALARGENGQNWKLLICLTVSLWYYFFFFFFFVRWTAVCWQLEYKHCSLSSHKLLNRWQKETTSHYFPGLHLNHKLLCIQLPVLCNCLC